MMKRILFLSFLMFTIYANSQEEKLKGDWLFNFQLGFGTLTAENSFKTNADVQFGFVGKEFILGKNFSLITGVEFWDVNTDFTDASSQQLFIKNRHVGVPVFIRLNTPISDKVSSYADFGFYGSHIYSSKTENEAAGLSNRDRGAGFVFGIHVNIGIKLQLNEQYNLYAGFATRSDLFDSFSASQQAFELTEVAMLSIGIGYKL